ncbi:hypothetical protein KW800_02355 [Candidatus Parcubacteria bacterium]|nr:hypothetical protein [Candidatus Parcubacteria bacterium]
MTIHKSQFENSLDKVRKVSLTSRQKGEMFAVLSRYAESHKPVKLSMWAAFLNFFKKPRAVKLPVEL